MSIKEELEKSKEYLIKTVEQNGERIVELTPDNVARVEAMIQNDSAYIRAFDKEARPKRYPRKQTKEFKYGGSTAYWVVQLKDVLIKGKNVSDDNFSFGDIIKHLIAAIDRENSTHLNADGNGRKDIHDRIVSKKEHLIKLLKNQNNQYEIIDCICKKTSGEKGRENLSFASKFAHYAAFYLFEGTKYQDGFSIYDGILIKALPKYIKAFSIQTEDYKKDYKKYQNAIDSIISAAEKQYGERISRNGFDHLLWYYHKGRQ